MSRQQALFTAGAFDAVGNGARIHGSPPVEQWAVALCAFARLRDGAGWAIGDLLLYGERFEDTDYEEACDNTGYKRGTLMNMKSVAKAFPKGKRIDGLSWGHHALAMGFEEDERDQLLARAKRERLGYEEFKGITRGLRAQRRLAAQSWPEGTFGLIAADPPWPYEEGAVDPTRQVENQYPPMPVDDICALAPKVQGVTAPDCVLYLWATSAVVVSGAMVQVLNAWGFEGRSTMVWVKDHQGMGYWARQRHEHLIVAKRGQPSPPPEDLRPDSVIMEPAREHSRKPASLYATLDRCYKGVPKLELFAREPRRGWETWGNEVLFGPTEAGRAVRLREEVPA